MLGLPFTMSLGMSSCSVLRDGERVMCQLCCSVYQEAEFYKDVLFLSCCLVLPFLQEKEDGYLTFFQRSFGSLNLFLTCNRSLVPLGGE